MIPIKSYWEKCIQEYYRNEYLEPSPLEDPERYKKKETRKLMTIDEIHRLLEKKYNRTKAKTKKRGRPRKKKTNTYISKGIRSLLKTKK